MAKKAFFPFFCFGMIWLSLMFTGRASTSTETDVAIKKVPSFYYCCITHKGPFSEIPNVIAQVAQAMRSQNISPQGPLMGIYNITSKEEEEGLLKDQEWEIGFPITPQVLVQVPLEMKQWTQELVAAAFHIGPYDKTDEALSRIFEWMDSNSYEQTGPIMERYLDMVPSQVKPESLRTEIWVPCRKKQSAYRESPLFPVDK